MIKGEKKVIAELRGQSEEAFNIIYKEYYRLIYYVIYHIVEDSEVANDLTSDTFITMYKKIDQHDPSKSFKYWLVSIAKNNAKQYLRKKMQEKVIVDNEIVIQSAAADSNINELLTACKKILTPTEYDVLNYKIIFDMTFVEIGLMVNVSKSEAFRIYKRALEKLRAEL